jgi:hypothetical protein
MPSTGEYEWTDAYLELGFFFFFMDMLYHSWYLPVENQLISSYVGWL